MRLRNSIAAEVLFLAFVYVVGVRFVWRTQLALEVASWYGVAVDGRLRPSLAGWWLGLLSLPVFQFLLLRWYYRMSSGRASCGRCPGSSLTLVPTHPDHAAASASWR